MRPSELQFTHMYFQDTDCTGEPYGAGTAARVCWPGSGNTLYRAVNLPPGMSEYWPAGTYSRMKSDGKCIPWTAGLQETFTKLQPMESPFPLLVRARCSPGR